MLCILISLVRSRSLIASASLVSVWYQLADPSTARLLAPIVSHLHHYSDQLKLHGNGAMELAKDQLGRIEAQIMEAAAMKLRQQQQRQQQAKEHVKNEDNARLKEQGNACVKPEHKAALILQQHQVSGVEYAISRAVTAVTAPVPSASSSSSASLSSFSAASHGHGQDQESSAASASSALASAASASASASTTPPTSTASLPGQLCVATVRMKRPTDVMDDGDAEDASYELVPLYHNFLTGYSSLRHPLHLKLDDATRGRVLYCEAPGAGKTLTALATIAEMAKRKPQRDAPTQGSSRTRHCSLVVTRPELLMQWMETAVRFLPADGSICIRLLTPNKKKRVAELALRLVGSVLNSGSIDPAWIKLVRVIWEEKQLPTSSSSSSSSDSTSTLCITDWSTFLNAKLQHPWQCVDR